MKAEAKRGRLTLKEYLKAHKVPEEAKKDILLLRVSHRLGNNKYFMDYIQWHCCPYTRVDCKG